MILELHEAVKDFSGQRALDGVSLSVPQGGFFSLVGPSGCGKTTTLRLVAGLEQLTSGDIRLAGESIRDRKPYERNVSTVFQNYALFPHLTALENVAFGLKRRGDKDAQGKATKALELVRLREKAGRLPAELSGGERQRVALARSLVLEPAVLLLDEPLSALDPQLRRQMRSELKQLQRRTGTTFLMVTHDQEEALSMSDTVAVLNRGRVEQTGRPQELYQRPATRFVAGFLGSINWIDGIGVRPEAVRISAEQPDHGARSRRARVESVTFLGSCHHVESILESGGRAVAEIPATLAPPNPGDLVHCWWHPADELDLS